MNTLELFKRTGLTPATKTKEELQALRKMATAPRGAIGAGGAAGVGNGGPVACFFKDPNGSDQCIPFPDSDSCTAQGGVPVAGNCPNA